MSVRGECGAEVENAIRHEFIQHHSVGQSIECIIMGSVCAKCEKK